MVGDGGGKGLARREALHGPDRVSSTILGLFRLTPEEDGAYNGEPAMVNGQPGAVVYDAAGRVASVVALDIADGLVQAVRSVVNPDKLQHLGPTSDLYSGRTGTYAAGHRHRISPRRLPPGGRREL